MAVQAPSATKRVEFVGLKSPFADPVVEWKNGRNQLSLDEEAALWDMERKRQMDGFCRYPGHTRKRITVEQSRAILERKGITGRQFTQDYEWGPHTFVVDMAVEDIELLMQMHLAHRITFVVLDDLIT